MKSADQLLRLFLRIPQAVLITLVKGYRLLLSPSLGSACRFEPTCSAYALAALQQHGAAAGSYLTLGRLVRCHPWCDGGFDPVTAKFSFFPASWFSKGSAADNENRKRHLFSRLVTPVTSTPSKKTPS